MMKNKCVVLSHIAILCDENQNKDPMNDPINYNIKT